MENDGSEAELLVTRRNRDAADASTRIRKSLFCKMIPFFIDGDAADSLSSLDLLLFTCTMMFHHLLAFLLPTTSATMLTGFKDAVARLRNHA